MSLHNDIMNIRQREKLAEYCAGHDAVTCYKFGHRDACHAAAELTNAADAEREEMVKIFKWIANNPGVHINNVVYTAKEMLKKLGEPVDSAT